MVMNIEVMFFGKLRDVAGISKETVAAPDPTKLAGLISMLESKHGSKFAKEMAESKSLRILVNGREYQILSGMETPLKDNDSVVLLPYIEGG
jgi:MoaD family protein